MISDTTIAATRTQGCEMSDKFKENFKIVLPAAIITLCIFLALTFNTEYVIEGSLDYDILRILPYALVLITALLGVNVFIVLSSGVIFSLAVGLFYGDFGFLEIFTVVGDGIIPYGAQVLTAASLAAISPIEVMPYLYYPMLMIISIIAVILLQKEK